MGLHGQAGAPTQPFLRRQESILFRGHDDAPTVIPAPEGRNPSPPSSIYARAPSRSHGSTGSPRTGGASHERALSSRSPLTLVEGAMNGRCDVGAVREPPLRKPRLSPLAWFDTLTTNGAPPPTVIPALEQESIARGAWDGPAPFPPLGYPLPRARRRPTEAVGCPAPEHGIQTALERHEWKTVK